MTAAVQREVPIIGPGQAPAPPPFTFDEAQRAADNWGFNCGPAAVAVITGLGIADLRPQLGEFELKGYTNPSMMWQILRNLGIEHRIRWDGAKAPKGISEGGLRFPRHGLARVQWEGPWTEPGVPVSVRYRHTHWVAAIRQTRCSDCGESGGAQHRPSCHRQGLVTAASDYREDPAAAQIWIFDVNCMCVGGWIPLSEWRDSLVPWLLSQCEPKSSGRWHLTHSVEIPEARRV
jgi:hypothetical protein